MNRYQQQVVKRMNKLNGEGPEPELSITPMILLGIVLMVGAVAWMFVVVIFSIQAP